jgi:transposase
LTQRFALCPEGSLAQTVIMEVGTDMSKFPSEKHFCSWLGLAPKHEISGAKVLKNKTMKTKNRAGQAFRMAAQSVKRRIVCLARSIGV